MSRKLTVLVGRMLSNLRERSGKAWLVVLIAVCVTVGGLLYAVVSGWSDIAALDWRVNIWSLIGAEALFALTLILTTRTWGFILSHLGASVSWRKNLAVYCTSALAQRLPTPLWVAGSRVLLSEHAGVPVEIGTLAVLCEWISSFIGGIFALIVLLPVSSTQSFVLDHLALLVIVLIISLALFSRPKVMAQAVLWLARRFGRSEISLAQIDRQQMVLWALLWSLAWLVTGVMQFFLVASLHPLGIERAPDVMLIWVATGVLSRITAFLPGSLVLRGATMAVLLGAFVPLPFALAIAVLTPIWLAGNDLLWYAIASRLPS